MTTTLPSVGAASVADKAHFLDWLPIPVVAMDTSHTLVYINRMAAAVAGMEPEECVGKKFWEVLYDSPACHAEKCAAGVAVRTGKVSMGEAHFKVRGRDWPVRVICSPRFDSDGRTVIGCFQVMYEAQEEIHVSREILRLVAAGRAGDLTTRGNLDEFKGNFRTLVEELNALLDAFVHPIRTFGESATALAFSLVSTPFGSTAYFNQITRGIFYAGLGIAFKNITDLTSHLVVPDDVTIRVLVTRGPAVLAYDNCPDYVHLEEGDTLFLTKHAQPATVLTLEPMSHPTDAF